MRRRFMPSPVAIHWLIAIAFTSVGYAMYLRYLAIENPVVGLACDAGLTTWLCLSRKVALPLYEYYVIGGLAVVAAVIHLVRPSVIAGAVAVAAAGLGLVLFNGDAAGLAIGLLVLSFARPAGTQA